MENRYGSTVSVETDAQYISIAALQRRTDHAAALPRNPSVYTSPMGSRLRCFQFGRFSQDERITLCTGSAMAPVTGIRHLESARLSTIGLVLRVAAAPAGSAISDPIPRIVFAKGV